MEAMTMDIGIKAEVKGLIAKGYSRGEAIDRVAISQDIQNVGFVRVGKAQRIQKREIFAGLSTAFRIKALPL